MDGLDELTRLSTRIEGRPRELGCTSREDREKRGSRSSREKKSKEVAERGRDGGSWEKRRWTAGFESDQRARREEREVVTLPRRDF